MREHAKAAREAGHWVVVLHLAGSRPDLAGNLWTMEEELDPSLSEGIEAHHVFHRRTRVPGASYGLYLWSAIGAYRRLCARGFRPDVIHAHVYGAGVPAALVARRSMIPLVVTEHYSGVAQRSLSRLEVRKARFAYERAARVLPVSRYLREAIRSLTDDVRFEIVPNVVDTSIFFPPVGPQKIDGERRMLFVGNLESLHQKGFATLLQALARLGELRRDWRLDVIGDGTERVQYEKSCIALGLSEQVTFHGSQPKPLVAQAMQAADLLVLPSRVDNLPSVVVEALTSGLPVVSTTVGGIPELVDDGSGTLVPPDDPDALARALDEMLDAIDTFDRRAIAAAARSRYGLDVVGTKFTQIYESVRAESQVDSVGDPRAQPQQPGVRRRV